MASGHIKGFWHRVRNAFHQKNLSYADRNMDTPERSAEKRQDATRFPPRYPGDNVPPGAWSTGGLH